MVFKFNYFDALQFISESSIWPVSENVDGEGKAYQVMVKFQP